MSLTDIFSIPFLICLAICVLLIGCSSIYFYQKISHQDHKIESMVSLITSLAEEQIKTTSPTVPSVPIVKPTTAISFGGSSSNGKIPVSDDEESSSEEEYSSSDDEEEEGETSSEEDEDSSSECEDEEPKIQVEELNLEKLVDEVFDLEELDSKEPEPSVDNDIKSIHLEADEKITDFSSVFKTIHINMTEDESVGNYKKMSLTKLREVAQSLGHGDTSKLKKNELLKLLEAE